MAYSLTSHAVTHRGMDGRLHGPIARAQTIHTMHAAKQLTSGDTPQLAMTLTTPRWPPSEQPACITVANGVNTTHEYKLMLSTGTAM
jgi:hypothetical protein